MAFAVAELFSIFFSHRGSLFGNGSPKMVDADLRHLYTATSLMQIDDIVMRCVCRFVHYVVQTIFFFLTKWIYVLEIVNAKVILSDPLIIYPHSG